MAKKKKKPTRARTARRAYDRTREKLFRSRQRLAALEPGGSAQSPIEVPSASVIERRAQDVGCLRCDEVPQSLVAHDASGLDGRVLRRLELRCPKCRASRVLWLTVVGAADRLN